MQEQHSLPPSVEDVPETSWNEARFRQEMEQAVRRGELSLAELPGIIQLEGELGKSWRDLRIETEIDPYHGEVSLYWKLHQGNPDLHPAPKQYGNPNSIEVTFSLDEGEESYAGVFHTHGTGDFPPSMRDMCDLQFSEPRYRCRFLGVATTDSYYLCLSTKETHLDTPEALATEAESAELFTSLGLANSPTDEDKLKLRRQAAIEYAQENGIAIYAGKSVKELKRVV